VSGDGVLAIDQLSSAVAALSEPWQRGAAVDDFFAKHSLPLVEGQLATFVVRTDADAVYLRHRVSPWPNDLVLKQIPETDVWFLTIGLESGSRVECAS